LNLSDNPLRCDCHLAAVMKNFMESKRQSVFSSSGAICDRGSKEFPDAVAAEVLGLLHCPRKNIANNQLTHLPKNAFLRYPSLRKLHLSENIIDTIEEDAFKSLKQLRYLCCDVVGGLVLSNRRCRLTGTSLAAARIANTSIQASTDAHLQPKYRFVPFCPFCRQLDAPTPPPLSTNGLSHPWSTDSHWPSHNGSLNAAPNTINNVLVLAERKRRCEKDSDLQHQSIPQQDLDVAQDCPKACTCSQLPNRVQRSTDDVITFTALRSGVVEIVEPSLKVICTNADLASVPTEIPENTKELYLDHNSIEEVNHGNFAHLKKLEVLSLHHNRLVYLRNGTFTALLRLKVLSFDDNPFDCGPQMSWLSDWMQRNQALVMASPSAPACAGPAHLKGSPLVSLSTEDFHTPNGNSMELSCKNNLCSAKAIEVESHCPGPCTCKNQRVDCSGKALKEIPRDLPPETRDLFLEHNEIKSIDFERLQHLKSLETLAFGQNPLHCDCNLRWLHVFFRLKYLDNGVSICAGPEQMKFKSIFHSNPKDFSCSIRSTDIVAKCNPCVGNPCLNGGRCETISSVEFKCTCEMPFYGDRCEKKVDACFEKPCKSGGTCEVTDDLGHYRCNCPTGFTGLNCEENVDDCKNVECKNGGVCTDGVNNYTCECTPGFRGKHCEDILQYCVDENPCQNDGVCVMQKPAGFKCICPEGWGGDDCSKNLDDCEYNKCQNGGVCIDQIGGYTCDCPYGFTDRYCEATLPSQLTAMKNSASFGCAYNRCLNGATCQPDMSPTGYRCHCPFGYGGNFCEKVFSLYIPSTDVHVAVQSPSRGCFLPRGNISLTFSTSQKQGILFFFSEAIDQTLSPHRFLIAELHQGHVKISFAIDAGEVGTAYSMSTLTDNKLHQLDVVIIISRVEMYVDGNRNALIQSVVSTSSPSKPKPRALISAAPIYLGGAPKRLLRSISRAGVIEATSGIVACIESFHINGKAMDFSQALKNSSSLKPGCKLPTNSGNSLTTEPNSKALYPRSKVELAGLDNADVMKDSGIPSDCRSKELVCLNGGACIPGYVGNGQDQRWTSSKLHVCRCPAGFEGVRCETPTFCRRHSRYSYIYDPDTGCISTSRIVIRSCSGSCRDAADTSLMWQLEQQQRKRRWRKKAQRRVRRHRSQWISSSPLLPPPSLSLLPRISRMPRSATENTGTCCQPVRFKQKNIQFHCPQGGGEGRVYSRWFRFVRKCGCITNCHNRDGSTAGSTATDAL
uniref:Slit homolog 2 protein n=1 Tax=Taenia asiatica TaxID=60517 RepID=A0A0R3W0Y6_TAEAS